MTEPHFVDTNVLVCAVDASEPEKQPEAAAWLEWLWRTRRGRLSYQVLSEFYVTATRKLKPGLDPDKSRRLVRDLLAWDPVRVDEVVLEQAWAVQETASVSLWDALIVGAAQLCGSKYLLSEDLPDGQTIGSVRVINPFRHAAPPL